MISFRPLPTSAFAESVGSRFAYSRIGVFVYSRTHRSRIAAIAEVRVYLFADCLKRR